MRKIPKIARNADSLCATYRNLCAIYRMARVCKHKLVYCVAEPVCRKIPVFIHYPCLLISILKVFFEDLLRVVLIEFIQKWGPATHEILQPRKIPCATFRPLIFILMCCEIKKNSIEQNKKPTLQNVFQKISFQRTLSYFESVTFPATCPQFKNFKGMLKKT